MRKIFSSKTHWFVALLLAAALLFGGCSSDSDDDDDDSSSSSSSSASSSNALSPYLPSEYASREIAALYTASSSETDTEDDGTVWTIKATSALYFFSDSGDITWLETNNFLGISSTGETESIKRAHAAGTFTISGNYTNGTITVTRTMHEGNGETAGVLESCDDYGDTSLKTLSISNGIFTRIRHGETESYTKQ